ncbi:MAG: YIP1 family protein [Candidatus Aenigmarchaeota archaeon]|nr:YIP1 family protein [Candidatus Aenigmarchaeota archaeon]
MDINALVEKIKSYLLKPEEAFEKEKKTGLVDALKYLLMVGTILAVLSAVISAVTGGVMGPMLFVTTLVTMYVMLAVGSFIGAIILHIFALIFGAKKGYEQTYKVTAYSMTPTLVLGWVPVINFITGIWTLYLEYLGLKKLQDMKSSNAILAVLVPVIIGMIIAGLSAMWLMSSMTALMPMAGMSGLPFGP